MDREEIDEIYRYKYTKKCPCCGLEQEILTQKDKYPEYYTEVYLKCQCGEFIEFVLPVD